MKAIDLKRPHLEHQACSEYEHKPMPPRQEPHAEKSSTETQPFSKVLEEMKGGTMRSIVWDGDVRVSQPFGCTAYTFEPAWAPCRLEGGHKHCGIDIALWKGSPLRAARPGTVIAVGYGFLQIQVGAGLWDWYVHIDRAVVAVGQTVAGGQLVAFSGDKAPAGGYVDGAHLHFEVQTGWLNSPGSCRDPEPVLTQRFSSGGGSIAKPKRRRRDHMPATSDNHNIFVRGGDNALWYRHFDEPSQAWLAWKSLGGVLGEDEIEVTGHGQRLDVYVVGTDQAIYHLHSSDAGATWSAMENLGGVEGGQSLVAVGPGPAAAASARPATPVDLAPVLTAATGARDSADAAAAAATKAETAAEAAKANTDQLMGLLPGR